VTDVLKRAVQTVTKAMVDHAVINAPEVNAVTIGTPVSRVDGHLKVTGAATYASDTLLPDLAYAALALSPIARGRIIGIDASDVEALPGVLSVFTHQNAPRLRKNLVPQIGAGRWSIGRDFRPLQDDRIRFAGQPVALVAAETYEQAVDAASRLHATCKYVAEPTETDLSQVLDDAFPATPRIGKPDYQRGDVATVLANAVVRVDAEYATPPQTNNPLGLFATVASWDGDQLTLYDANQTTGNVAKSAASVFGLTLGRGGVDVITPFVGGGFGAGLRAWPHAWLAAMAAREVGRPMKLVLTREQMFTAVGRRAQTIQQVTLGADTEGRLTAIRHDAVQDTSRDEDFIEALTGVSRTLYACPNVETHYRLARLDRATPTYMRCPGEAETLFALECALDELAIALNIDPIDLRLRNDAERDQEKDKLWSSKSLGACYVRGAELIDWPRRTPQPGSMRDGNTLIGLGTATATYPAFALPASASARIDAHGIVVVRSAVTDIGPGTATAMTQVAADALGLPIERIHFELGDSRFPKSPQQGGSMIMASVGPAVLAACLALKENIIALAVADSDSPLFGTKGEAIEARDGKLMLRENPSRADSYEAILIRAGKASLEAEKTAQSLPQRLTHACEAFGAQFAEVHVDVDLRTIRVARLVGVFGVGRVINSKLAHSQLMGGMIWGLSQALLEDTTYDHRLGRIVNASFGDYLIPVNADVRSIEVELIPEEDPYVNALGVKGVGEIGLAGVAPAIANAVYHATGIRVRELPITIEKLLDGESPASARRPTT
jgi:xanthine dehydrogenase YagR molybdenum-binding subunit